MTWQGGVLIYKPWPGRVYGEFEQKFSIKFLLIGCWLSYPTPKGIFPLTLFVSLTSMLRL